MMDCLNFREKYRHCAEELAELQSTRAAESEACDEMRAERDEARDEANRLRHADADAGRYAGAIVEVTRERDALRAALKAVVAMNGEEFRYLDQGIGTNTTDGKAWLTARRALGDA